MPKNKEISMLSEEEKNNLPDDHQEQCATELHEYLKSCGHPRMFQWVDEGGKIVVKRVIFR